MTANTEKTLPMTLFWNARKLGVDTKIAADIWNRNIAEGERIFGANNPERFRYGITKSVKELQH